jgi:hypothetical protein
MNNIIHIPLELPKLKRITTENGRLYETPSGKKYPSVTTVTGLRSKASIMEWRKRVGEEEANKISSRACRRGTKVHALCEDWLNNKPVEVDMFDRPNWDAFLPVLGRVNNVYCLEAALFSHFLEVAGTVDCIAEFDGVLSVIDFKTSRHAKKLEDIGNYFVQTAMYAVSLAEMTGIQVKQLVILMSVDDEKPEIFIQRTKDWVMKAVEEREFFKDIKGF